MIILLLFVLPICSSDVDECLVPGTCGQNSRCENTMGSYTCINTAPLALEPLPGKYQ